MLVLNKTDISVCNRIRACANQNHILQHLFNGKIYVMSPVCLCVLYLAFMQENNTYASEIN